MCQDYSYKFYLEAEIQQQFSEFDSDRHGDGKSVFFGDF